MTLIIALLVLGLALILAELVLPGGLIGALGAMALATAVILAFIESSALGLSILSVIVVLGFIGFWAWLKFFPSSRLGKHLFLETNGKEWRGYDQGRAQLVGQRGVVASTLRPCGVAIIDGRRIDVESLGEVIEKDAAVVVTKVEGNRTMVVLAPADTTESATPA